MSDNSISAAAYQKLIQGQKKQGRYGKKKQIRTKDGNFDSRGEYRRWQFLVEQERLGIITDLERQIPYSFDIEDRHICVYKADHRYRIAASGDVVVEDFKGRIITPEFTIKRKMMFAFFQIQLLIVTKPLEPIKPSWPFRPGAGPSASSGDATSAR